MEVENSVLGLAADDTNKLNLEEKFSICHSKDEANSKTDISAKELTDFVDSLIMDIPELTDEEVNKGIEKILEKSYPEEKAEATANNSKIKKVTLRTLFVAALISAVMFSCICVVGNSNSINIENGFVTFVKGAVKIIFFGEDKEECIDVKTLLEDLDFKGFKNIILPQKLYDYKSSVPVYSDGADITDANNIVTFDLYKDENLYSFRIEKSEANKLISNYFIDLDNSETVINNDLYIYVFEYDGGTSSINFVEGGYRYFIQSEASLTEMINTAQTIIKTEE